MKKALLIVFLINSIISFHSAAQDALTYVNKSSVTESVRKTIPPVMYEFTAIQREYELDNISVTIAGGHPFGELISKKVYLLESKYTSEVALIPGNPQTKTIIKKPVIYDAVKRIEKQLKKSVKKEEISSADAAHIFNKVLDVALNTLTANTQSFEAAIESLDRTELKIELFMNRVKLTY